MTNNATECERKIITGYDPELYTFRCPFCKKVTAIEYITPLPEKVEPFSPSIRYRCKNCKEFLGNSIYNLFTSENLIFNK